VTLSQALGCLSAKDPTLVDYAPLDPPRSTRGPRRAAAAPTAEKGAAAEPAKAKWRTKFAAAPVEAESGGPDAAVNGSAASSGIKGEAPSHWDAAELPPTTPKKARGRPKKDAVPEQAIGANGTPPAAAQGRRGRPRKTPLPEEPHGEPEQATLESGEPGNGLKRARGRPRKTVQPDGGTLSREEHEGAVSATEAPQIEPKRARGRPRKTVLSEQEAPPHVEPYRESGAGQSRPPRQKKRSRLDLLELGEPSSMATNGLLVGDPV
jgi:AT hook motif